MSNDGSINVDYGLDASRASAELKKLQADLQGVTANLLQAQKIIETRTDKMVGKLSEAMAKINAGSANYTRNIQRQEAALGQNFSMAGKGGLSGQANEAAFRSIIADARSTTKAITARLTDELVKGFQQNLRTMDAAVQARLRNATYSTNKLIQNSSPDVLSAKAILDQRRTESVLYEAANGKAALTSRNISERMNANGGADIIGIQSRLLVGYQALSLAFNAAKGLSTFVVQLDAEFHQFQAITGTTNSEMAVLKDRLIDVSEQSKFTALEIAKAATILGQAGFSAREVADSIGAISLLATAAGTDLSSAVDVTSSVLSIFNLQVDQTADVANTMTAALNLSKLTIDKLALGFQYSGNVAAQMGVTFQELTGVLGALSNSGIRSGSTLGTGLRQLLIDIQNPSKEFKKTLDGLKLSEEDVNIESNGLVNVLNRLKTAGFTSADAFGAFEVRAAATYSALSNNLDLASKLQAEFTLSAAAVEANAIQMESLANTSAKFGSAIGTVAYKAFAPLLSVLQNLLDMAARVLSVLNDYPAVLNTIAVAATAVGTALALMTASAVFRGLLQLVPMIGSFGTVAATAAAATEGLGVAAAAAAAPAAGLIATLGIPVWIAIAAVVTAAAVAYSAFGSSALSASDRVDILRGQVQELEGDLAATTGQVGAIDQTIANLIRQKAALDADPLQRRAKILEIKQAFKELAGQIDTSTASVQNLIDALGQLKAGDFAKNAKVYGALIEAEKALLEQSERNQTTTLATSDTYAIGDKAAAAAGITGGSIKRSDLPYVVSQALGPAFKDIASYIAGLSGPAKDSSQVQGYGAQINLTKAQNTRELSGLLAQKELGNSTPDTEARIEQLTKTIDLLDALNAGLTPLLTLSTQIDASKAKLDRLKTEDMLNAVKNTEQFADIEQSVVSLSADLSRDTSRAFRETRGKSSKEILDGLNSLQDVYAGRIADIQRQGSTFVNEIMKANPDFDRSKVETMVKQFLTDATASITNRISSRATAENKLYQKIQEDVLKEQQSTIDKEIQSLLKLTGKSYTKEELKIIEEAMKAKFDQKRKLTADIFDAKIAAAGDDANKTELELGLREDQKQINQSEQDFQSAIADQAQELAVNQLKAMKDAVDADAGVIESKIKNLIEAIRKSRPGPAMDSLIAKFNELAAELAKLQSTSGSLDIQAMTLSQGSPLAKSVSDRAAADMKQFIAMGYSQAAASGLVGNFITESGLDPSATGDRSDKTGRPTAFGKGQWRFDRWDDLQTFASDRKSSPYDSSIQNQFADQELRTKFPQVYAALMAARTPEEAARIVMNGYEKPNADPSINHINDRIGNAVTLGKGDYAADNQNMSDAVKDLAKAEFDATTKGIKASTNFSVKNATEQIQTLVAQSKLAADPETVKKILGSVNDQYQRIIDAKTKAFNQENAQGLKDGDEDLIAQRTEMLEGLRADRNQKVAGLLETYMDQLDKKTQEPVLAAQRALDAAQLPENAGKFTQTQIVGLETNEKLAERKALLDQVANAEAYLLQIKKEQAVAEATYGANSPEANFWLLQEIAAKQKAVDLGKQKLAIDAATAQQGPSVQAAIQSATEAWSVQAGVMQRNADGMLEMVPLAAQVEKAWGPILDNLTNSFSTLFMDLASGTMSATEAFKAFGLSVVQSLMQAIAKALALQVVMSLLGGSGGIGGGMGGDIISGLLGAVGMSLGGGVKGAALGEMIKGTGHRDGVLRKLMPGEFVLRQSAVSAIGADKLDGINNQGNNIRSESLTQPSNDNQTGGTTVNVWVVSQDNVPPPSPTDIIATVADNIQRRGSLKTLIQQVVTR
ncbi:MAG: phage tail tape measure protein [Mesorhizobium sp.]|uniref:phage tail tape measure protein n=1 Tax=Mesorhizobium sp. TaxID=1871066 RepID=UPI000FE75239|nr:phage tail tape measure protein [Mesorhizobium sp.]RWB08781.1 MAG: phage tail tape measure protein [Mesorhizobium sp.]RWB13568.1 MAG: phage tail tape measure protein [Mesorhizobium sp.]